MPVSIYIHDSNEYVCLMLNYNIELAKYNFDFLYVHDGEYLYDNEFDIDEIIHFSTIEFAVYGEFYRIFNFICSMSIQQAINFLNNLIDNKFDTISIYDSLIETFEHLNEDFTQSDHFKLTYI